ncbi:MAG: hypothetical protein Q8830_03465, partial [Candidatus Phytoplasma australasiaticum]|nr:hypothetical protein [Candidatus Phytoplasma australasiaticum]
TQFIHINKQIKWSDFKNNLREELSKFIFKATKKKTKNSTLDLRGFSDADYALIRWIKKVLVDPANFLKIAWSLGTIRNKIVS